MNFIYTPFSYLLKGCLAITGSSYFWALLFFALAIQIILLPLAIKQQKSQIKMAQIKPKEMAIREKYKGRTDRVTQQKMTMEIQQMYQDNGYNQFGGCLPLLIQLPIIMILFSIVRNPVTYAYSGDVVLNKQEVAVQAVEFYEIEKEQLIANGYNEDAANINVYQLQLGANKDALADGYASGDEVKPTGQDSEIALVKIICDGREDLQKLIDDGKLDSSIMAVYESYDFEKYKPGLPNYWIGPLNLVNEPDFDKNLWLMLVPLLVFITSFLSTKVTRKVSGAAQQTDANGNPVGGGLFMEVGMPLISAWISYGMAAAIGVYWIWRTILGMFQSIILSKVMPIPKVTEEMIAEAKKEMKAKQKKKKVITIEVDEDDNSYDDMIVSGTSKSSKTTEIDPAKRTPRKIEMLTADDDDDAGSDESNED